MGSGMRYAVAGCLAALLAGCSTPPRDIAIAQLDLADGKTLASLQAALSPDDRAAIGTYALLHWPKSKFYCGEPIGGDRTVAATVGEAIEQTRAYEAKLALAQATANQTAAASAQDQQKLLIDQMERLVLQRDMLFGKLGPNAQSSLEAHEIKTRLAILRSELLELRDRPTT